MVSAKVRETERVIEKRLCQYARDKGWYTRKFTSPGHRGVPDRLFIRKGRHVFMELKAHAGRLTPLQQHEIDLIIAAGGEAYAVYSFDEGVYILERGPFRTASGRRGKTAVWASKLDDENWLW